MLVSRGCLSDDRTRRSCTNQPPDRGSDASSTDRAGRLKLESAAQCRGIPAIRSPIANQPRLSDATNPQRVRSGNRSSASCRLPLQLRPIRAVSRFDPISPEVCFIDRATPPPGSRRRLFDAAAELPEPLQTLRPLLELRGAADPMHCGPQPLSADAATRSVPCPTRGFQTDRSNRGLRACCGRSARQRHRDTTSDPQGQ